MEENKEDKKEVPKPVQHTIQDKYKMYVAQTIQQHTEKLKTDKETLQFIDLELKYMDKLINKYPKNKEYKKTRVIMKNKKKEIKNDIRLLNNRNKIYDEFLIFMKIEKN